MKSNLKFIAAIAVAGLLMAYGEAEYKDAVRAEDRYCDRVSNGLHEDHKGLCDDAEGDTP